MATIQKAALIYNPASGRRRARRVAQINAVTAALGGAGVDAVAIATQSPGSAGDQAREAIAAGCDVVFACGGDGTVNEVLQGVVGSNAALAVIPLGTANSLATDLRLPRDPVAAVRAALAAQRTRVAVGQISFRARGADGTSPNDSIRPRFFIVAAGIGPDAHFFYRLTAEFKQRFGYLAYVAQGWRIWATHGYTPFEIDFSGPDGALRREIVSQLLAVRISEFGGVLRRLAPGAALRSNTFRLVLFKTPQRFRYLQYMTRVFLGGSWNIPDVELVDACCLECRPLQAAPAGRIWRNREFRQPIYVETDGEVLGKLPVKISIVPAAVTLLVA